MDTKQIESVMNELYSKMTDEQKEKASHCKTVNELLDLAGKEGMELPDNVLDAVSGGGFNIGTGAIKCVFSGKQWALLPY